MSDPDPPLPGDPERRVPVQTPTAERPSRGRSAAAVICLVSAAFADDTGGDRVGI